MDNVHFNDFHKSRSGPLRPQTSYSANATSFSECLYTFDDLFYGITMVTSRRLPPLNALRAFEAAARHLSFTKAAEELHVTPGAISQQVKSLEEYVGTTLFKRLNRSLLLTEEAEACLPALRLGFDKLAEATEALTASKTENRLVVSTAPSFASKWLVPRLGDFQEKFPEIDVWVTAALELADFAKDGIDVAIRYGSGNYPNLVVERLLDESVIPVCSPKLIGEEGKLRTPADLKHYTLIHDVSADLEESHPDWSMWLKAARVEGIDGTRGLRFNQTSLALEAAMNGKGVALTMSSLASQDIENGRLVKPFDLTLPVDFAYFLAYPKSKANLAKVQKFAGWIKEAVE